MAMARGKLNQGTQRASQVRVGLVLVLSMVVLAFGIYQVGRLFDVFASRYSLFTLVENSAGLASGAPVTLAGQRVGQIDEVRFIPVEERVGNANIRIRFSINRNIQDQIREDSYAVLRTQGLLGDRYIDISPGSPSGRMLAEGDLIAARPALDIEQVVEAAARTLDQVQAIAVDLQATTARLARGEGTMGALLSDDRLYERMTAATTELTGLLATVNRADGTLARLIRDPAMYEQMEGALVRLDSISATILSGQGTLGRLVHDDALYDGLLGIVDRADTTLVNVEGFVGGLTEADGTINRLLEDPELYDQLLRTIVDIQNLLRDIRENPREYRPDVNVRVF
jgi:phospholipid/cholesterol/gamma-HCH transport system substrate-binding protein